MQQSQSCHLLVLALHAAASNTQSIKLDEFQQVKQVCLLKQLDDNTDSWKHQCKGLAMKGGEREGGGGGGGAGILVAGTVNFLVCGAKQATLLYTKKKLP